MSFSFDTHILLSLYVDYVKKKQCICVIILAVLYYAFKIENTKILW